MGGTFSAFLRRTFMRKGTPSKPNSCRKAFPRNLVEASVKGWVPETKATKVGGREEACVTYRTRDT